MEVKKIEHKKLKLIPTILKDERELSAHTKEVRRKEPSGVYVITNLVNGKFYIGSSVGINTRWWNHLVDLRNGTHENPHLQNSFNKYGEENFAFSIIEEVEFDEEDKVASVRLVRELEQIYLDYYQPFDGKIGYNLSRIANGGKKQHTIEDIINGKSSFNIQQFNQAIDMLCNTTDSFGKISEKTGIKKSTIKRFYYKVIMPDLMKSFTFLPRTKNKKLEKIASNPDALKEFKELIVTKSRQKELRRKYDCDISILRNWCKKLNINTEVELESRYIKQEEVCQYTLLGEIVKTFPDVYCAAIELNINAEAIKGACKGVQKTAEGYYWSYGRKNFPKPTYLDLCLGQYFDLDKRLSPIVMYDVNHIPVAFYSKIKDIEKDGFLEGEIYKNCAGQIECYKGYYFRYAKDVPEKDLKYLYKKLYKAF